MENGKKTRKDILALMREKISPVMKGLEKKQERRDAERFDVMIKAQIISEDGTFPITIQDISCSGMKISRDGMKTECIRFVKDQNVKIKCDEYQELDCIIMWTLWETAGVKFTQRLTDDHPLMTHARHLCDKLKTQ